MVVATSRPSTPAPEEPSATRELWTLDAATRAAEPPPPSNAASDAPDPRPVPRFGRWLRDRMRRRADALELSPLADPSRPEIAPLRRGGLEAWWSARRARSELDEYLRERLSRYLARSGASPDRLPVTIAVESGRATAVPRPAGAPPPDWLARYVRTHGEPALAADLERARTEAARADAALDEARERLGEARRDLEAAARAPALAASDADETSPYGRPAVPPPWSTAIGVFIAIMVLGDAWQFALPLLRNAGVSPGALALELRQRPEVVALPLVLALGASACLFIFAAAALRRARALLDVLPARWQAAIHLVAGAASLAMALGLAWAILVPGAGSGRTRDLTAFLVAMALPIATPPLVALARRLHAVRAEALRAAAAWDHVRRAAVAQWTRMNALASATERDCAALEASRAAWTQRLYLLRCRAAEVERRAADAADAEAAELRRLAEALVAALAADRRAYLADGRRDPHAALEKA